jgi:microcompartment protein CcmL/EutN
MKLVLTGWFIVKAAMPSTELETTYVIEQPNKNISVVITTHKQFKEDTWIQIQTIADCKRDWDSQENSWDTFCQAESFEELECKPHNIFPINGIIYC